MPTVKLENKTARILHIGLGGGAAVTVPPTDPSTGSGGVVLQMDDTERERFDRAVATPAVQEWVEAEELVITEEADPPAKEKPRTAPPAPPAPEKKPKTYADKDPHP